MADKKISELTALGTTPADADEFVLVDNDAGETKKVAYSDFKGITASSTDTLTNKTIDANGTGNSITNIDLTADVTGTLPVASGGTGATTLGDGYVLLGSGTGAVTALDVTAKGSIMVGDGTTDPVALAVGSNDQVLTADSSQASGLKWATAGGGSGIWTLIDDDVAGSAASTWNSSVLATGYKKFLLEATVKRNASSDYLRLRFNGDTGSNYRTGFIKSLGTTVSGDGSAPAETSINLGASSNTMTSSQWHTTFIEITNTTESIQKNLKFSSFSVDTDVTVEGTGTWMNTANEISGITILTNGGNSWTTGSTFRLWGSTA